MNPPGSTSALVLGGRLEPRALESFDARRLARRLAPPLVLAVIVLGAWQLYVALSGITAVGPALAARGRARARA